MAYETHLKANDLDLKPAQVEGPRFQLQLTIRLRSISMDGIWKTRLKYSIKTSAAYVSYDLHLSGSVSRQHYLRGKHED